MKKRILALLLGALGLAAFADTAIPSGKAVYDVTLTFTDYPELDEFGDWPVEIDLLLGQAFIGERVGVVTNQDSSISLTVRAVWDIKKMIDYSKTSTYVKGQSHIYMRPFAENFGAVSADGGYWTGTNAKFDFTEVTTIEGFIGKVDDFYRGRTMTKPKTRAETDPAVLMNSLSIALVRTLDGTSCTAGQAVLSTLRVRFNRPLSAAGYATVTSMQIVNAPTKGTVFDFNIANPVMSADGCELSGLVNVDAGTILALINSDAYSSDDGYKIQGKIILNNSSTSPIATGVNGRLSKTDGDSVTDLSQAIKASFIYRTQNASMPCRVVAFELERKTAEGGLFLMRW